MKKIMAAALAVLLFTLCACGGVEGKLTGSWYVEGSSSPAFSLHSDGTCEISGEYGAGTWSVVDDKTLKLTNFYGETESAPIKSISGGKLILGSGSNESVFYNKPNQ